MIVVFLVTMKLIADAIITNDSGKEEETCKMFLWKGMDNYSEHKELFLGDGGTINKAKN